MGIIELLNKIRYSMADSYYNKKWLTLVLKVLLLLLLLLCMTIVLLWIIGLIYNNIGTIIVVVGGIGCIIALFLSILPKRQQKAEPPHQPPVNSFIQYDPITLENTYKLLRSSICLIIGEVADIIKVRKPASYSQLDAPTHYDIVANVPIYHYLVPKQGGEVDVYTTMGILQNAIEQKLNNNELPGISQSVMFYNGQAFPALMIDNIHDHGNFLQIDMAVASEYYCRYREQRLYSNMSLSPGANLRDTDF